MLKRFRRTNQPNAIKQPRLFDKLGINILTELEAQRKNAKTETTYSEIIGDLLMHKIQAVHLLGRISDYHPDYYRERRRGFDESYIRQKDDLYKKLGILPVSTTVLIDTDRKFFRHAAAGSP